MTTSSGASQPRPRFLPIAVACASVLAAGAPASAHAHAATAGPPLGSISSHAPDDHRVVHLDARRDVIRMDLKTEDQTPDPLDRGADLTKTVVDHQSGQVVVQARVRELHRSGYRLMIAEILTSSGKRYELDVDYSTKPIGSRVSLVRSSTFRDVDCPEATWLVERSRDRVTGVVPNSCLGDPAWIRVGVGMVTGTRPLRTGWADDSRTAGRLPEDHPTLGPRQHTAD